ncbi:MAG: hypothetical protein V7695_11820 [Sulfitobacter sp.]
MRGVIIAALVAVTPVSATALSCTPHSVEVAYQQADADDAHFVIVRGSLDFDAGELPKGGVENQSRTVPLTQIKATLSGRALSQKGFSTPFNKSVTLEVACYGPWCARPQIGHDVLAFVELTQDGGVIATNPCGGYLFNSPVPKMISAVKSCFAGKTCQPLR